MKKTLYLNWAEKYLQSIDEVYSMFAVGGGGGKKNAFFLLVIELIYQIVDISP